jgi:hypothetical protein
MDDKLTIIEIWFFAQNILSCWPIMKELDIPNSSVEGMEISNNEQILIIVLTSWNCKNARSKILSALEKQKQLYVILKYKRTFFPNEVKHNDYTAKFMVEFLIKWGTVDTEFWKGLTLSNEDLFCAELFAENSKQFIRACAVRVAYRIIEIDDYYHLFYKLGRADLARLCEFEFIKYLKNGESNKYKGNITLQKN